MADKNLESGTEQNQGKLMDDVTNHRRYRPLLYGIIGLIILLLLAWGLLSLGKYTHRTTTNNSSTTAAKEVNLTQEQRQALEQQVADAETDIRNLKADASTSTKFNAYRKLASAKYLLGQYDEALTALDTVAVDNQNNVTLWSLYANIYRDKGDIAKARDSVQKALSLDKSLPELWLAQIDLAQDTSPDAIKALYQQALDNTNNSISIITAYAAYLEKIGDKQGAIDQWQKAITAFPQGRSEYEAQIARLRTQ